MGKGNRPTEPPFNVGDKVQLDSQPFEWTVTKVKVNGLPWVAGITRKGHRDEIVREFNRDVDTDRLSLIGPDGNLPK